MTRTDRRNLHQRVNHRVKDMGCSIDREIDTADPKLHAEGWWMDSPLGPSPQGREGNWHENPGGGTLHSAQLASGSPVEHRGGAWASGVGVTMGLIKRVCTRGCGLILHVRCMMAEAQPTCKGWAPLWISEDILCESMLLKQDGKMPAELQSDGCEFDLKQPSALFHVLVVESFFGIFMVKASNKVGQISILER